MGLMFEKSVLHNIGHDSSVNAPVEDVMRKFMGGIEPGTRARTFIRTKDYERPSSAVKFRKSIECCCIQLETTNDESVSFQQPHHIGYWAFSYIPKLAAFLRQSLDYVVGD